jgi:hypothetical protein
MTYNFSCKSAVCGLIVAICSNATAQSAIDATDCPNPRVVSNNISGDTTWQNWVAEPSCLDYVVRADLILNDEVLTIEAGSRVGFDSGRGLRVRGSAGLIAAGISDYPIVLTGTTAQRGYWKGVVIGGRKFDRHVMTFTTIEWTGGGAVSGTQEAGLILNRDVKIELAHNTVRQSAGYGLFLAAGVEVTGGGANVLTENALGPAYAFGSEVNHVMQGGGSITGNDTDEVTVYPNSIREDVVWGRGVYRVVRANKVAFTVRGSLTLDAGVTIRFEPNQSMRIISSGGLAAVGTADDPVVITGTVAEPGSWGGLHFNDSDNAMNRLDHVLIEYGGGVPVGTIAGANLVLRHGSTANRVEISNTTLRRSKGYGIYIQGRSEIPDFKTNKMTENIAGAAYVGAPVVRDLLAGNEFVGNVEDEIRVQTGSGQTITESATWRNFEVPYYLKHLNGRETDVVGASITLEPGVKLLFGPGVGMSFQKGSSLKAVGLPENEIEIEAKDPGSLWKGFDVYDSSATFDYVTISGAGSGTWGPADQPGTVTIRTYLLKEPPSSSVIFGDFATLTGGPYNIVFGYGDTFASGCGAGIVYVPKGDTNGEHCL